MPLITQERIRELSAEARSNVETKANDRDDTSDTSWRGGYILFFVA